MRVRMKVDVSGTRAGHEWPPRGSVIDLPDDEAADYCRAGMAEPVAVFDTPETATPDAEPETATPPKPETPRPPRTERRGGLTKDKVPTP